MEISNAKYYKDKDEIICITCTLNGKNSAIPLDPANTDYQAILEWAKIDGNTIAKAD
jgi:hypothetical protein